MYKRILRQIENMNKKQKIKYILEYLLTHNKNLNKTQIFLIEDLITLTEDSNNV